MIHDKTDTLTGVPFNKLLHYRKKEVNTSLKMRSGRGSYKTKWSLLVRNDNGN